MEDVRTPWSVDPQVRSALAASPLHAIPRAVLDGLLSGARPLQVPAGGIVRREDQPGPHLEVVIDGLVRGSLHGRDGRTLTIRYARPGALLGTVSLFDPGYAMPGSTRALLPTVLLQLRPATVLAAVDREPTVGRALLADLSERVREYLGELHHRAFASVRQRVARHLLDLASEQQLGSELVAVVTQQGLADAVGSVREVVERTLQDLRREGAVEPGRGRIVILLPDHLLREMDPGRTR